MTIATVDQIKITQDNYPYRHGLCGSIGDTVRIIKVSWFNTGSSSGGTSKKNHGKPECHYVVHVIRGHVTSICHWYETGGAVSYTFATLYAARCYAGLVRDTSGALLLIQPSASPQGPIANQGHGQR